MKSTPNRACLAGLRRAALGLAGIAIAGPVLAIDVTVQPLADLVIPARHTVSADVVASNRSTVAAEVAGTIRSIGADVGASVEAGDVLVTIDPRDYELALRQAIAARESTDARIREATARLQRAKSLAGSSYVSADELLTLETDVAVLERTAQSQAIDVSIARLALDRTRVKAAFAGVVEGRQAQVGGYVTPGTALMTLTATADREVAAAMHTSVAAGIEGGSDFTFVFDNSRYPLQPLRVSAVIDPDSRTRAVRFRFVSDEAPVGAYGSVQWVASSGLVPVHLIVQRNAALGVFVAKDGTARFHALSGASEGRAAPHDLPADALIIVDGRLKLQDGDTVTVTTP